MAKSQPDFTIVLTRPGGRRLRVRTHKDAAFKKGQTVAQQMSATEVAFIAVGANKPEFSFMVVDGDEAVRVDAFVTNPITGLTYTDIGASWTGRRDGATVAYKFEECACAEGGDVKTTEGEGFTSQAGIKLLATRAKVSTNSGPYRRTA